MRISDFVFGYKKIRLALGCAYQLADSTGCAYQKELKLPNTKSEIRIPKSEIHLPFDKLHSTSNNPLHASSFSKANLPFQQSASRRILL